MIAKEDLDEVLDRLEILRIDVDASTSYCDPTGTLKAKYERANEMLDDAIEIVKNYFGGD